MDKVCYKCKELKYFSEYHKNKSAKDGHQTLCKSCKKVQTSEKWLNATEEQKQRVYDNNKKYRQTDKGKEATRRRDIKRSKDPKRIESKKQSNKRYVINNPDKRSESIAKYNNSDKGKQSKIKYYLENKDVIIDRNTKWRADNPKQYAESIRIYKENNKDKLNKHYAKYRKSEKGKMNSARDSDRRRVDKRNCGTQLLTLDQWVEILCNQNNECNICKISFDNVRPERDHIIPVTKGGRLVKDNVQALCRSCNASKGAKIIN